MQPNCLLTEVRPWRLAQGAKREVVSRQQIATMRVECSTSLQTVPTIKRIQQRVRCGERGVAKNEREAGGGDLYRRRGKGIALFLIAPVGLLEGLVGQDGLFWPLRLST